MSRLVKRLAPEEYEKMPPLVKWINKNDKHRYGFILFIFTLMVVAVIVNVV